MDRAILKSKVLRESGRSSEAVDCVVTSSVTSRCCLLQSMTVDRAMLRGEAVVETGGSSEAEACMIALSMAELPTNPAARFARLFAVRTRWELHELEPYLADLQVCGLASLSSLTRQASLL